MEAALFAESNGRRNRRFSLGNFRRHVADFSSWINYQPRRHVSSVHPWNLVVSTNGTNFRGQNLKSVYLGVGARILTRKSTERLRLRIAASPPATACDSNN